MISRQKHSWSYYKSPPHAEKCSYCIIELYGVN